MKERIKEITSRMKHVYWWVMLSPLFVLILNRSSLGEYAEDELFLYKIQTASIIITLLLIPLGLRLFHFNYVKKIKNLPLEDALLSYENWGKVRIYLLGLPLMVNSLFYYMTLSSTCILCAAMTLVAFFFCVPSESRLKNELDLPEEIN